MKVIYPNNITSVTADKQDENFPAEFALTDHVKQAWRSTDNAGKLTLNVAGGSGVAVFGTNASTVTITVRDGLTVQWDDGVEWDDGSGGGVETEWLVDKGEYVVGTYGLLTSGIGAMWAEYPVQDYTHIVDLEFAAAEGMTVFAGVVRIGPANGFRDPQLGIREGVLSYDIVKKLNNGATYIRPQDNVRTFEFDFRVDRDRDFYTFMQDVFLQSGMRPLAWRLSDRLTNWDWAVYARPDSMPSGVHKYAKQSIITVSLIEEV